MRNSAFHHHIVKLLRGTALGSVLGLSAAVIPSVVHAGCTVNSSGSYVCEGTLTNPVALGVPSIPALIVTTHPGFSISVSSLHAALDLSGSGSVIYQDHNTSTITNTVERGLQITNSAAGADATVSVTTAGKITSGGEAVQVLNSVSGEGSGTITITANGAIDAGSRGIDAENNVEKGSGTITITASEIKAAFEDGVFAWNTITDKGDALTEIRVSGAIDAGYDGIYAENDVSQGSGAITIAVNGAIEAGSRGIDAWNNVEGKGSSTISIIANGAINADGAGIYAGNYVSGEGFGTITITANGAINANDGIYASNYVSGEGSGTITVTAGDITATEWDGVYAANNIAKGDARTEITVTGAIDAGAYGIFAINNVSDEGSGTITITVDGAINADPRGIYAGNHVSGKGFGSIAITANSAINAGEHGIDAINNVLDEGSGTITITANSAINAVSRGIYAGNIAGRGSGTITITTNGTIGADGYGIDAWNRMGEGFASITITANDAIDAGWNGIDAKNYVSGEGSGTIIIAAKDINSGWDVEGEAGVFAGSYINSGNSLTDITVTGKITANGYGVASHNFVENGRSDTVINVNSIDSESDAIWVADFVVKNSSSLPSTISISTSGSIVSRKGAGILALTSDADTYVTVSGLVQSSHKAIHLVRLGDIERSATLELLPGYALEGETLAEVTSNPLDPNTGPELSQEWLDLANTHLVLGGSGITSFDLSRIDNREEAIEDGDLNRITGFGTLAKTGDSTWLLTGANDTDAADGFLSASVDGGILALNEATFVMAEAGSAPAASGLLTVASGTGLSSIGASTFSGNITNSGSIILANSYEGGNGAIAGDTLTITGNYQGNNGTLVLDTVLGGDSSATDRLDITGTAAGTTFVSVVNAGGLSALTDNDGIMIVSTGSSESDETFLLSERISAGAFDYNLYFGGNAATGGNADDQNWYLRSDYRSELPLAASISPIAMDYGYAMLGTLHERIGEIWLSAGQEETKTASSGWARLIGDRGFRSNGDFERRGPDYDYTFGGIQAGLDLLGRESANGSLDLAGFYIGYGAISADVQGAWSGKAGDIDMDAYTLGAYWTHKAAQGWYTDAIIQGTWYSAKAMPTEGQSLNSDGFGILTSLEGGYGFDLGNGLTVEPQAQLVYQNISFDDVSDAYGRFVLSDQDSLRARLGVRVSKQWNIADEAKPRSLNTWVQANLWHEFMGETTTTAYGLDGTFSAAVPSSLGGTWGEIGAGVSGQVTDAVALFATGAYSRSLDSRGRESWNGRIGLSVKW